MNQHYLQLYADFIVKVGVNVRPRQNFIVRCPVTMPDFAHACVRAGYEAGAKTVVVRWEDDKLTRLNMELADEKDLTAMKPYELRSYLDYAEDPDGCCTLAIHAEDPEALAGLDAGKLNRVNLARRTFMKPWQEYTMNDRVQWCVAAVPAPGWAAKVFPELPLDEAVEKLWARIFDVCRVSTGDPVGAWQKHVAVTKARRDRMNALERAALGIEARPQQDGYLLRGGLLPHGPAELFAQGGIPAAGHGSRRREAGRGNAGVQAQMVRRTRLLDTPLGPSDKVMDGMPAFL